MSSQAARSIKGVLTMRMKLRMGRQIVRACVIGCLGCAMAGCFNPDKGKLLFRPAVGDSRAIGTLTTAAVTFNLMAFQLTFDVGKEARYTFTVKAVDAEGTATLDVVYDFVKMKLSTGGEGMPAGLPLAPMLAGLDIGPVNEALNDLAGKSFTMRVSRHGEVLEVSGADEIARAMAGRIEPPAGQDATLVQDAVVGLLGNDGTLMLMSMVLFAAPDQRMKPGDSWQITAADLTQEAPPQEQMPGSLEITHTFKGREHGAALIDTAVAFELDKDAMAKAMPKGPAPGVEVAFGLTGDGTGTVRLNDSTGWLIERSLSGTCTGAIEIANLMGPGTKMAIPIQATFETRVQDVTGQS
ncbi:MAG: hypothetical protein JXR94_24790 [Candidatus Hydrogenedentes bacterium]|nr:hypothetical protein [Candidatus Hydrogenedentota bacterium]